MSQATKCSDCGGTGEQDMFNEETQQWKTQPCSTCNGDKEVQVIFSDDPNDTQE